MSGLCRAENSTLAAALELAAFGFFIYPTPKKNGRARVKWRTDSTSDADTIQRWWTRWPDDLICLDCGKSKVAVIDADTPEGHGVDGLSALLDLELQYSFLPLTRISQTPSGGRHFLFRDPDSRMKSTAGVLAPGVDTRGVGGMIVLPPSMVRGKGAYRWLNDLPLAHVPEWVIEKAGEVAPMLAIPDAEFDPVYTEEQFAERIKLIDVDQFSGRHDLWFKFMLACTHSSTVADGKSAFMDWTTGNWRGEYACDADAIFERWDYNHANHRNKRGGACKVGTFNHYLSKAGHDDLVLFGNEIDAAVEFDEPFDDSAIETFGDPATLASEVAARGRAKRHKGKVITHRKPRPSNNTQRDRAIRRAAALAKPYQDKSDV